VGHGFLISSDLPGVTPSDEVTSKYFCTVLKTDIPTSKTNTNAILDITSPLLDMSLPAKTRKILEEMHLSSDFLSSDSSLSDPPSDLDLDLDDDLALYPTPKISHSKSPHFMPPESASGPRTPVKRTKFLEPEISKDPRPKRPKISPYFPKVPDPPQSCLPFPPIDAPFFGLVQEQLAHEPFKLLIATIFLNRTRGGVALPVLFKVFERYPTIHAMASADLTELVSMIRCLGFQNQRAKKCIGIAQLWQSDPPVKNKRYRKLHYPKKLDGRDIPADEYLDDEDPRAAWEIAHLPGVGAYSLDSWRIFCRDELRGLAKDWKGTGSDVHGFVPEWKSVLPQDKELRAYLTWMWLKEGWVWDCHSGDLTPAGEKMLRAARREGVAHEEDGNWVLQTSPVKKAPNGLHAMD
jgi:endonuclease III